MRVEASSKGSSKLDVLRLIFANWNESRFVEQNIGRLKDGVTEEAKLEFLGHGVGEESGIGIEREL